MGVPEHFIKRARDRGITHTDPEELWHQLVEDAEKGRLDRVMRSARATIYRFFVDEGTFFAVFPTDFHGPVTVFTQGIMRNLRRRQKEGKKYGWWHSKNRGK